MNAIKRLSKIGAVLSLLLSAAVQGMNLSRPHDIFFRPPAPQEEFMQAYVWIEHGLKQTSYASDRKTINVLKYLDCDQNALKMLDGFADDSCIGQKRAQLRVVDDGVRGHFCVNGDLSVPFNIALAWRFFFGHDLTLGAYLPIRSMKLKNVCWQEQTRMIDNQDAQVKSFLTNDFFCNVKRLGKDLELCDWSRTGIGDFEVIFEYMRNFEQQKPLLKNVLLDLRVGLTFPTGLKSDPDLILALPFGHDGATTVPFGGGIELLYGTWFKFGFDVELTHLFGNTRTRRIKTADQQTELLLLEKTRAYKDWGMQQQFTIYAQLYHFFKGFSFKVGYRFFKQGDSVIALCSNEHSALIANTAQSIEDWTAHDVMLKLSYDFGYDYDKYNPGFALFARIPFDGKRSVVSNTIGLMASIDF